MNPSTAAEKRALRSSGQKLEARLRIGKAGLTSAFLSELAEAFRHNPLVKIRFEHHKEEKVKLLQQIVEAMDCEFIQRVGHTALVFKRPSASGKYPPA